MIGVISELEVVAQVCDPSTGKLREQVGSSRSAWVVWGEPFYRQANEKANERKALYLNSTDVGINNGREIL